MSLRTPETLQPIQTPEPGSGDSSWRLTLSAIVLVVAAGLGTANIVSPSEAFADGHGDGSKDDYSRGHAELKNPRTMELRAANVGGCPNVAAHRGAPDKRVKIDENTMNAFERADSLGFPTIEYDDRRDGGGKKIVFHDSRWLRVAPHVKGYVVKTPHWKAKKIKLRYGEHVPDIADVLDYAKDHGLRVQHELKPYPGINQEDVNKSIRAIERRDMVPYTMITSNQESILRMARIANPDIVLGRIIRDFAPASSINLAEIAQYADAVMVDASHVRARPDIIKEAHKAGLLLSVRDFTSGELPGLMDASRDATGKMYAGSDAADNLVINYDIGGKTVFGICRGLLEYQPPESSSPSPTASPSESPSGSPSVEPTPTDTPSPTAEPSSSPSESPTVEPSTPTPSSVEPSPSPSETTSTP